ncbi:MAG TPA: hypothetical protein VJZ91_07740 [Blastocatellia bacterium]|nr:hypothetical protein [Blastocatellia bacterium]
MNPLLLSLLMAFAALTPAFKSAGAQQPEAAGKPALVVLRGRVACLDASGKRLDAMSGCDGPGVRYALSDRDGKLHEFSSTDTGAAVFTDMRVRQRDLQVTAQLTAKGRLEVVRVQSVHEGKLYDLYYFCELCNIRAYAPGLCPCCRNEMEFRETPAADQ